MTPRNKSSSSAFNMQMVFEENLKPDSKHCSRLLFKSSSEKMQAIAGRLVCYNFFTVSVCIVIFCHIYNMGGESSTQKQSFSYAELPLENVLLL